MRVSELITENLFGLVDSIRQAVRSLMTPVYNVVGYGAEAGTDCTGIVQGIIDTYGANPICLYFPQSSTEYILDTLSLTNKLTIRGAGKHLTKIKQKDSATNHMLRGGSNVQYVTIEDVFLDGNKANQTSAWDAIHLADASAQEAQWIIRDVYIDSFKGNGVYVGNIRRAVRFLNCNVWNCDGHGVYLYGSDCLIDGCSIGLNGGSGVYNREYVNRILNSDIFLNLYGVTCVAGQSGNTILAGNSVDKNYRGGVVLGNGNMVMNNTIRNNSHQEEGTYHNVYVNGSRNQVIDNYFTSDKAGNPTYKDVGYHVYIADSVTDNWVRNVYTSGSAVTANVRHNIQDGYYNRVETVDAIYLRGTSPALRVLGAPAGYPGVIWGNDTGNTWKLLMNPDNTLSLAFNNGSADTVVLRGNTSGHSVLGAAWDGPHLMLGVYHFWMDSTGRLRVKNAPPTGDTDGTVVGTQT